MKRSLFILILVILASAMSGQTLLLEPNGDGGFETGSTLAANGWTIGTSTLNTWYCSNVPEGETGARAAFVSSIAGGGSTWTYATPSSAGAIATLYRDITFPTGETDIRLSFDYIAGQNALDGTSVLLAPVGYSWNFTDPTYLLSNRLHKSKNWTRISFGINPSYAGNTMRLIFLFSCRAGTPANPPFTVDNVKLSSRVPSPLSGSYTIDKNQAESGSNFSNWGDAVIALNTAGISGAVTFDVAAGQNFYEILPYITRTGTEASPIVFRKDPNTSGDNPRLLSPGHSTQYLDSYEKGVITLIGADWYSFDGIDFENYAYSGLTDNIRYGVQLLNSGSSNGCQYITVRNSSFNLNASAAVIQHNPQSAVSAASGAHSYNLFENLSVSNSTAGVYINSPSSAYPDLDCVIRNCVMGTAASNSLYGFGIYVKNGPGVSIYNNSIRNLTVSSPATAAITVFNSSNVDSRRVDIYNNKISDISSNQLYLDGIYVFQALSGEARIYNNTIYGLKNTSTNSSSYARGIMLQEYNSSGGTVRMNVDFNTLIFDSDNYSAMNWQGINLGYFNSSGDIFNIRNNIIAFYGTARFRRALASSSAISTINPASVIDHNVYYSALRGTDFSIHSAGSLYAWTAATGFDANSRMEDPRVLAYNDPHIRTDVQTPVESGGSFFGGTIPWAQYDIDGNRTLRNSETPDIGAYEGTYIPYPRPDGPAAPAYTNPANGASGLPTSGWQYQWTAPAGSVLGYQMFLGTNNPPSNIRNGYELGDVLQTTYSSHQNITGYFWKIVAYNDYGASNSPVWSFSTINPYPDPSIPVYPPMDDTGIPVSSWDFSWLAPVNTGGSPIQQYMFALYELPSLQQVISMQMLPATTLSYPMGTLLKYNTDYRWMATPYNSSFNSPQSGTNFNFRTTTIYQNTLPVDNGEPDPPLPVVQIPSLTGLYDFSSWAEWNPSGVDVEHSGLAIYVRGNYQNRRIEINPDLGYVPDRIVYRTLGSGGWQNYEAQPDWTADYVYMFGPTGGKDAGDLEIVFQGGDETLPVVLASFTATPAASGSAVTLSWTTHSETNLSGYYIYRNSSPNLVSALNLNSFIPAANSSSAQSYSWVDSEIYSNRTYYYWLNSLDLNGSGMFFGPVSIHISHSDPNPPEIPMQTLLESVFPNPFNPSTTLSYSLSEPSVCEIQIFNQRGQKVYHYSENHSQPGRYQHVWNAPDLASGVYFMIFRAGPYSSSRKLVLMK